MIASLNQSGSSWWKTSFIAALPLEEILEVALGADARLDLEDARRQSGRVQLDEVARAVPEVALIREQVVDLERLPVLQPELGQRQVDPAGLGVVRVEVDDHQHDVRLRRVGLRVAD